MPLPHSDMVLSHRRRHGVRRALPALALSVVVAGCLQAQDALYEAGAQAAREHMYAAIEGRLDAVEKEVERIEDILLPVRLLRDREKEQLRRYLNADHLDRARRLGVPPQDDVSGVLELQESGRLVRLADSAAFWTVRELDHSLAYVTPDTEKLLGEIGRRFQAELAHMDLPPFRLEVSSALRTAETQARLRGANENAASGQSTHEFGTTVDIAYDGFAAPARSVVAPEVSAEPWIGTYLRSVETLALERVAARKSRELQAVLGRLLTVMQSEGRVLVTLEELQPVFHITIAEVR